MPEDLSQLISQYGTTDHVHCLMYKKLPAFSTSEKTHMGYRIYIINILQCNLYCGTVGLHNWPPVYDLSYEQSHAKTCRKASAHVIQKDWMGEAHHSSLKIKVSRATLACKKCIAWSTSCHCPGFPDQTPVYLVYTVRTLAVYTGVHWWYTGIH